MSEDSNTGNSNGTESTESQSGAPTATPATGIESLPEWAQTELTKARQDAAKYRTERNGIRDELAALKEQVAEFDSTKDQLEQLLTEKSLTELTVMRLEAALEAGLDRDMAERLRGETAEELAEDARSLAGKIRTRPVDPTQGKGSNNIPLNGDPIEEALKNALRIS